MNEEIKVYDKRIVPEEEPAANMLELVIRRGMPLETIEKVMELQERHERREAQKAFYEAKSAFKEDMPTVIKDKTNSQYNNSKYASEAALIGTISPHLSKYGLEASFKFPKIEKGVAVTCILSHRLGHSEEVTLEGPLDTSGSKNPLQQVKSTVTYLRKATFEAVLGIASSDPLADDDGNAAGGYITEDQADEIEQLMVAAGVNTPALISKFLKWADAESVQQISGKSYGKVKAGLNDKIKAKVAK